MTDDQVREWAREAGFVLQRNEYVFSEMLQRFARLARAEAFEAAAKTAEAYEPRCDACPSGVSTAIRALAEREKET